MSLGTRCCVLAFRLSLWSHPRAWRRRFADEAVASFAEGLARRLDAEGSVAAARYAFRAVTDALAAGWTARADAGRLRRRESGTGGDGMLDTLFSDLRYIGRRMLRAPLFTGTVVTILALGVGANAAVFSVLKEAVLAPVPFADAERLVVVRWAVTEPGTPDTTFGSWSYPELVDFREPAEGVFEGVAAYASRSAAVTEPGDAESVGFEFVSAAYFGLLRVSPALGRFFLPEEEGVDTPPDVVVISHAFWVQRFGADPQAVGRTVTADGGRLRVVGVAPEGFDGLTGSSRLWIPIGQARKAYGSWALEGRGSHWFNVVGRLRPGIRPDVAEERLASAAQEIDAVESFLSPGEAVALDLPRIGEVRSTPAARVGAWLAMAAALVVLTIAVANLASLLLARGRRERQETAVRLALGAPKARLVRERLTEGLALAVGGGMMGLLLAAWALAGLRTAIPARFLQGSGGDLQLMSSGAFGIDAPVALLGLVVALLAGALFSAAPAVAQSTLDLVPALRRGGGGSRGPTRRDANQWLVGAQVALSVVLLVGAGLLLGSLYRLHGEQEGFDADRLLVLRYSLGGPGSRHATSEAAWEFHRAFRDRVRALPGVRSAALGTTPPLAGAYILTTVRGVVGQEPYPEGDRPTIGVNFVDDGFFRTVGIRTLQGGGFPDHAGARDQQEAILSRMAATRLFPGQDPVGREIDVGMTMGEEELPFRVVGVVDDVLYDAPAAGLRPDMYLPMTPWTPPVISLMVRTTTDPFEVLPDARRLLADLDPTIPFWRITTGDELRAEDVADTRILVILLCAFAGLAMLLATAGLWAVVARAAAERRREIGLRMALGARAGEVEALVFRDGLIPIAAGGLAGLTLALVAAPGMDALLFGLSPRSPGVFVGSATVLILGSLAATWLPARRAARVDPVRALSTD
jgi:putative ABC transport system permease protein